MGIWMQILSMVLNAILGGGLLLTFLTLRSYKKKSEGEARQAMAQAEVTDKEADRQEIDNLDRIAKMWREQAELYEKKAREQAEFYEQKMRETRDQVEKLDKTTSALQEEVRRLININTRIVKSLDRINADNYEKIVAQIKEDITNHNG